jgi:hypothetical protein
MSDPLYPIGTTLVAVTKNLIAAGVVIDFIEHDSSRIQMNEYAVKWAGADHVHWYPEHQIAYFKRLFDEFQNTGKVNVKDEWNGE